MTLRIARALVWLQWRMVVNRLTRSSHRDELEQASRWGEVILRVLLAVLLLPAVALTAAAAVFGGWLAGSDPASGPAVGLAAGFAVVVPLVWMLLRPLAMLGTGGVERGVLLRLLPVPAPLLRNAEVVRAMAEPVIVLFAPALLLLPFGVAAAGRPLLALATLVAGALYLALAALLGNLATLLAQLLLRGRRRAELITLVFLVVLSTLGIVPQLFVPRAATPAAGPRPAAPGESGAPFPPPLRPLPPVAYGDLIAAGASGHAGTVALDVALLAAWAIALYGLTVPVHRRLTTVPESGSRRPAVASRERRLRLPFVAPATAAIAAAELRAVLRTVRGKLALLYPALMTVMLAVVFARRPGAYEGLTVGPLMLGAVAVLGTVAGTGVLACNQFAIQGRGLILELLLPFEDRRLSAGKVIAIGALVAAGLLLALVSAAAMSRTASPALWLAVWLAGLAAYAAASPVAVALSALLVKPVELSRIGRAGQPNALASLLYLVSVALAAAPAAALIVAGRRFPAGPWAGTLLVGGYAVVAVVVARAAQPLVERIVAARRENLALVVAGR